MLAPSATAHFSLPSLDTARHAPVAREIHGALAVDERRLQLDHRVFDPPPLGAIRSVGNERSPRRGENRPVGPNHVDRAVGRDHGSRVLRLGERSLPFLLAARMERVKLVVARNRSVTAECVKVPRVGGPRLFAKRERRFIAANRKCPPNPVDHAERAVELAFDGFSDRLGVLFEIADDGKRVDPPSSLERRHFVVELRRTSVRAPDTSQNSCRHPRHHANAFCAPLVARPRDAFPLEHQPCLATELGGLRSVEHDPRLAGVAVFIAFGARAAEQARARTVPARVPDPALSAAALRGDKR